MRHMGIAPSGLPFALTVELGNYFLRQAFQFPDTGPATICLLLCPHGIMGDDEAMTGEGAFRQACFIEGKTFEGFGQVGVTAGGDGQNEFQLAIPPIRQFTQLPDVFQAQEAAVGYKDDPLDRKAGENLLQHALRCLRLADIAGMDGVHLRQAISALNHTRDELPGNAASFLVHAIGADVGLDFAFPVNAHGRQVVEGDGKILIDQRAELTGQSLFDGIRIVHQCIHGTKQMLVRDGVRH